MFLRNILKLSLDQCFSRFFLAYNYHNTKHVQAPTFPANIRRAQVKVGLINLCKGLFSLNARIYYKLKSGT